MSVLSAGLTAPKNAISIIRGQSKTYALAVTDKNGDPVDLTGSRVIFSVKTSFCAEDALIRKDSNNGTTEIEITNALGGLADIKIVPSDTNTLDATEYIFDVWVVLSSGKQYPVIPPSKLVVEAGVTVFP
jgi:hypothetical protein